MFASMMRNELPPPRFAIKLASFAALGSVPMWFYGPVPRVVTLVVCLGFVTGVAIAHRRSAAKRGVPEREIWQNNRTAKFDVAADPVTVVESVIRALRELPHASVTSESAAGNASHAVKARTWERRSMPAQVKVYVEPTEAGSRVRIESTIHGALLFDFGRNWEYIDLLSVAARSTEAHRPDSVWTEAETAYGGKRRSIRE
jgi:hypothetical protein